MSNLDKGVGRGRSMQDIWRAKGMTEEQIEERWKQVCELNSAVQRRRNLARLEAAGYNLHLGDGAEVAITIEQARKRLSKELKVHSARGRTTQSAVEKRVSRRREREAQQFEREYNPKIKGLAGTPGLKVDEDGTIRLQSLREQRPDIFEMQHEPLPGGYSKRAHIARGKAARGVEDGYGEN